MNKYLLGTLFLAASLFAVQPAEAGIFSFLHKKKTEKKAPQKTSYEKILTDQPVTTAAGPLLTLHKADGKLYIELPKATLGKDFLLGVTLSSVSNASLGTVGFRNSNPVHFRFVRKDSVVVMDLVNTDFLLPSPNAAVQRSAKDNYTNLSFLSFPVKGWSKDSASVLIDASSFFLKDNKFFPVIGDDMNGLSVNTNLDDDLTHIKTLKSFKTNASVTVERSYSADIRSERGTVASDYPITIGVNYTLMALPEHPMVPRLSDTRIGLFLTNKYILDNDKRIENTTFVRRWRVEPADTAAYMAGRLVAPKKHIVYYVDPGFPDLWKQAIRVGVLRWNKAFERIGFKDVIQVRDYPTAKEDPQFDPDNLEYSCLRYVPTAVENAMGPSWSDPRTGEIINGSVYVYRGVASVLNSWRFIQTSQVDSTVRAKKMPDEAMRKSLEYVIAHEIGHTLGFMHNMAASFAYPVDSLRSKTFTDVYGTTPSIMDYARHNYVAQPGDPVTNLDPPALGIYDYYAIDWTYRAFPELKGDYIAENKKLRDLIESHAGDPLYRYGLQQEQPVRDPSAIEESLGNDPVKASEYGVRNLKYIVSHLDSWIKDDDSNEAKGTLYRQALSQAFRYANHVHLNVAGIYLYQTSEKSGLPRYKVVPHDQQRASALWMLRYADEFTSLGNPALEAKLPGAGSMPFKSLLPSIQAMAMNNTARLALSYYLDSTSYSPTEYATDVYNHVFAKTLAGKENLTPEELQFQNLYVRYLLSNISNIGNEPAAKVGLAAKDFRPQSAEEVQRLLRGDNDANPFAATAPAVDGMLCGHDHGQTPEALSGAALNAQTAFATFGKGYGEPGDIWANMINRSDQTLYYFALRTRDLLRSAVKSTKDEVLRAHYQVLLKRIAPTFEIGK